MLNLNVFVYTQDTDLFLAIISSERVFCSPSSLAQFYLISVAEVTSSEVVLWKSTHPLAEGAAALHCPAWGRVKALAAHCCSYWLLID